MYVLALENLKGGQCKTTLTKDLAGILNQVYSKRVCVMDLDPSCNLSAFFRQAIGQEEPFAGTVVDYVNGTCDAKSIVRDFTFYRGQNLTYYADMECMNPAECIHQDLPHSKIYIASVSLIPGDERLNTSHNAALADKLKNDPYCLRKLLMELSDRFDYCLVDFPPEQMGSTDPGLFACDGMILPCEASDDSLNGATHTLEYYDRYIAAEHEMDILGIVLTRVALQETAAKNSIVGIQSVTEGTGLLFDNFIRRLSTPGQCRQIGTVSSVYDLYGNYTSDVNAVAHELLGRLGDEEIKKPAGKHKKGGH